MARFGPKWAEASVSTDSLLNLSPEELQELGAELDELLEKWGKRSRDTRKATPASSDQREHVFVFLHAFPFDNAMENRNEPNP
ncbi:hypothetical protein A6E92_31670 [Streptomyces sp. S8]|nr:hypothetical protein A6E92_00025 [Streptomyces sp. S8]ARI56224.1 hypothetical protein A6E92_31670 [Streptomyces sp. S8]